MIKQIPFMLEGEVIGFVQMDDGYLAKFPRLAIAPVMTLMKDQDGVSVWVATGFVLSTHEGYVKAVDNFMKNNVIKPLPEESK